MFLSIWTGERGHKYMIQALQLLPAWFLMTSSMKRWNWRWALMEPDRVLKHRRAHAQLQKIKTNFWGSLVVLTSEDTRTRDAPKSWKLSQLLWAHIQLHPLQPDLHPDFQNKALLFSQLKVNTEIWTFGGIVCGSHDLVCSCKSPPTGPAGIFSDRVGNGNSSPNSWTVACKCNMHVLRINKVFKLFMIAINDIWMKRDWAKTSTLEIRSSSRSDRRWWSQLLDWSSDEGTLQHSFIFKERRKVADGERLHAYEQEMTCTRWATSRVHSCEVFHC